MFGMLFNGLTLGLGGEARGLTVRCGLLYGHNVYSLGLVLVTGRTHVHTGATVGELTPYNVKDWFIH